MPRRPSVLSGRRPHPERGLDVKALAEVAIYGSSGRRRGAVGVIDLRMPDVRQRV